MALVEAERLSKAYHSGSGAVTALNDVSLSISEGEFISIIGPSGSGKSTLMHLLGLLDTPTSGTLHFEGRNVTTLKSDDRAAIRSRRIGFVFQSYNLLSRSNALENVQLPMIYSGMSNRERKTRAIQALNEVGLGHRAAHWPNQLSGGEQQRVAIARSIVTRPALVLADEPTGALDSETGAEIMSVLRGLNASGSALVLVTHDPTVASQADRILRLVDGCFEKGTETQLPEPVPRRGTESG